MNRLNFEAVMVYESPNCDIVEIKSEGVLCNSFEEPIDMGGYDWN